MQTSDQQHIWRIAEAKARLSEVLRRVDEEGPQRIGTRKTYVIIPEKDWEAKPSPRKPFGQWLIENVPRGTNFEIPRERGSKRPIPFIDEDEN